VIGRIIHFSIRGVCWCSAGVGPGRGRSVFRPGTSIDAVPDITPNQVQINTVAPAFTPLKWRGTSHFPSKCHGGLPRAGRPDRCQVRPVQVTVNFGDDVDIYWARQLVLERLLEAERELPPGRFSRAFTHQHWSRRDLPVHRGADPKARGGTR